MLRRLDELILQALTRYNSRSKAIYDRAWRYWCDFCRDVLGRMSPFLIAAVDPAPVAVRLSYEWTLIQFSFWLLKKFKRP